MGEYKPMKWYKSEFIWLLISLVWQLFWFLLIGVSDVNLWIGLIGTLYILYFTIKGITYAWIINPYNTWKRKKNKL